MKPTGPIFAMILLLAGMSACIPWDLEESDFPEITTRSATLSSTTSAIFEGEISGLKEGVVQNHGFVWSIAPNEPNIDTYDGITNQGESGNKIFQSNAADLVRNRTYLVRAFAQFDGAVYYGEMLSFITGDLVLTTDQVNYQKGKSMEVLGTLGGLDAGVGANQYGHCWSVSNPFPSIAGDPFSNLGRPNDNGEFRSTIEGLVDNQDYYIRSYVLINFGADTLYGNVLPYTTSLGDVWDALPNFPSEVPRGIVFVLEGEAYAVTESSLWKFQPSGGGWTQMEDYPGGAFSAGAAFVIGDTAYVGLGDLGPNYSPLFYKYTSQNQWTQVQDPFPGQTRTRGVSFSMGNKGYVGMGYYDVGIGGNLSEIYVYSPQNGQWNPVPVVFPGGPKNSPMVFTIADTVYICGGAITKDVWAFAPETGAWVPKKDFPGGNVEIGIGFSIGQKGYTGMGFLGGYATSNKFWEYDPATDSWTQKATLPGGPRRYPMGFALDGKGYVLCGEGLSGNLNDVWVYTPD